MVRQHHRLNGHEFEQIPGDSREQRSLACCSSWGRKELHSTQRLKNNNNILSVFYILLLSFQNFYLDFSCILYLLCILFQRTLCKRVKPDFMQSESEETVLVAQWCPTLCDPMDCLAHQAPLSMGFSRQKYQSGLPIPTPGHLPDPGIKPRSPALQADSFLSEPQGSPFYAKQYAKTSHLGHSCFLFLFCQGGKKVIPNKQFVSLVVYNGGFENLLYKDPDSEYFRLCSSDVCCNYSALELQHESCLSQYVNEWTWLCSNKTLFTITGS